MNKDEIKIITDWCINKGHSDEEINSLINKLTNSSLQEKQPKNLETVYEYDTELPTFGLYLDKDTGCYELFCERLISFDSDNAAKGFLLQILKDFTKWMKKNNYKRKHFFDYQCIFEPTNVFEAQYASVEDAYYAFKNLVIGCSIDISRFDLKKYHKALVKDYK